MREGEGVTRGVLSPSCSLPRRDAKPKTHPEALGLLPTLCSPDLMGDTIGVVSPYTSRAETQGGARGRRTPSWSAAPAREVRTGASRHCLRVNRADCAEAGGPGSLGQCLYRRTSMHR